MLESIYRAAGLRTGLFTSPHLVSFAERIQVNRQPVPDSDLARIVHLLRQHLEQFPAEARPTLFEFSTVLALHFFQEQQCDIVIWETGLGGRLDATNIVTPLACVITNIGWDHQEWLGDTLDKIAAEKAGILKPGVPVITGALPARGLEVIQQTAERVGAPLTKVGQASRLVLPLPGPHQQLNAAVAAATVRALARQIPVDDDTILRGLASVRWPGRMQIVQRGPDRTLVLDGAHNPDGAVALRAAFAETFPGRPATLLLGVLADKDWAGIARELAPLAGRIVLAPVKSGRALDPLLLQNVFLEIRPEAPVTVCASLGDALGNVSGDPLVLVAGSLYLIGEAMERLGLCPVTETDERALNEWTARVRGAP
jgi:dihydrofolate synthase/folylpolyglutamate synthase